MTQKPRLEVYYNDWGGGSALTGWVGAPADADVGNVVFQARAFDVAIGEALVPNLAAKTRARFSVRCEKQIIPTDIVAGRIKLFAIYGEGNEIEVRPTEGLLKWMARVAFNQNIFSYMRDTDSVKFILERIEGALGPDVLTGRKLDTPTTPIIDLKRDLTALIARTGTISADRTAIIGAAGNLLLYEGSNGLIKQYQETSLSEAASALAAQWQHIILQRIEKFRKSAVPFVQIIIPEKSSVIAHHYPIPVTTPTRLLDAVECWAAENADHVQAGYVSMLDAFRSDPEIESLFLKTDSHFATRGAMATTRLVLNAFSGQSKAVARAMPKINKLLERAGGPETPRRIVTGDLALRFFGVPLYEEDLDVTYDTLFGKVSNVEQIRHILPPSGNLNGTRIAWRHPDAPLKLRVVAFGNSFFERGANCTQLSWWFRHVCSEFHIAWSKDIDHDYLDEVKPDLVIAQTIERFLPTVPAV